MQTPPFMVHPIRQSHRQPKPILPQVLIRRSPVTIREATPNDARAIWDVLKAAVTTLVGRPYTQQQVAAWIEDENAAKTEQAFGPAQITFVAESANRIVGFARMAGDEVEALYVHPQHSGRRIGERLLAMVEDAASLRAIGIVSLDAALNAVPFYRAAGYEMVGTSRPLFDNGMELPCIRMRKVLHTDRRSKVAVEFGLQRCRPRTGMVSPAPRL